eukprot:gb/GECG01005188.1/.p1 GENE.gb/GECG01005188.1/~~gb/GECG01005188.1/.p1  ORF type:complete len:161 (+),score=12.79 gb/GECG01005188.1/:1-483(+)
MANHSSWSNGNNTWSSPYTGSYRPSVAKKSTRSASVPMAITQAPAIGVDIHNRELQYIIRNYVKKAGLQDGGLFMPKSLNKKDTPHISRWFSDTLKATIGCGIQMLRQTYVSSFLDDIEKRKHNGEVDQSFVNQKRKEIASIMGHSVGTQETVYSKFRGC